ncbi:kinesin-like protein KIFC3 [Periophthalmus magnuspinnatus]|uniref:kinesin-like protein KIFC3 n=1 Tax=Periophthalmus magnuspinnatus TaxID=409849 RepID=UPI00243650C1|nr:kinesin-like protein KIFC3 [Periophthalmus magnuspinnatus]
MGSGASVIVPGEERGEARVERTETLGEKQPHPGEERGEARGARAETPGEKQQHPGEDRVDSARGEKDVNRDERGNTAEEKKSKQPGEGETARNERGKGGNERGKGGNERGKGGKERGKGGKESTEAWEEKRQQTPEEKSRHGPRSERDAAWREGGEAGKEMSKTRERETSTPAARSEHTAQAVESPQPDSHVMEVQSLKSEDGNLATNNENKQQTTKDKTSTSAQSQPATEAVAESEELSLVFESFLHNNGMLYSCFNHHGNRVYVDETQKLQPFPQEWHSQGHFISPNSEGSGQQQTSSGPSAFREDDRTSSTYIQGKGTLMTYWFEERVNVCRFWDPQSGLWLILPLQWELNLDFVKARVQQVMTALPGLVDQKEITAALRHCNYDSEEVISVYLTMFGEILLQPAPKDYTDLNSFRALLERDRVIEELKHKLQSKDKEMETLFQRNSYLKREVRYLTDVVQHLNHKHAELEADKQEAHEKIRSLLSHRASAVPLHKPSSKPAVDPGRMRQVRTLTRDLNVSNKQLRSTVHQTLTDMKNQLQELREAAVRMTQEEQRAMGQVEELRSLYRKEAVERKSLYNKLLELQGNIRVFCRCRKSTKSESCLDSVDEQEVAVVQKGSRKKFQFDKVYGSNSTQDEVFAGTLPVISSCVDGYNVCILAYGQTGSGKTYTMMGTKERPGVNIRSIRELLRICAEKEKVTYTLKVSMLEIYNETLNDLLSKSPGSALDLRVQGKSVSVPGLTQVQVQTESDILSAMEMGEKNRKIAATKMNIQSSRSHLVVALEVEGSDEVSGLTSRGTLTLCDLAGSERISKTEATGQRLVEAAAINKSLTALGQVFSALKCNALHVPFRNSKLTHLLQPSLSGDAKCCVFVNVSPDVEDVAETLSTLQFGSSIRQVSLGKATQNIIPNKNKPKQTAN